MKVFSFLLLLLFVSPAFAQNAAEVPTVSFEQQVDIVVTAKQDPRVLEVKFHQEKENVAIDVIVDKNTDGPQAKLIAFKLVMLAKSKSLDDAPKEKNTPGKGLYNYRVVLAVPDGVTLVTATKAKDKETLSFEDPFQVEPLTRAGEAGR